MRRLLTTALALLIALTPSLSLAQQTAGFLGGKAAEQVQPPFDRYTVTVRNILTGQPVETKVLDNAGQFAFDNVPLNQRYVVELVETAQKKVLCTAGPYGLVVGELTAVRDINMNCKVNNKSNVLALLIIGSIVGAAFLGTASASR